MGLTDVALAKLNDGIEFENAFMEMDAVPKCFVHSTRVHLFDEFLINSFSTGKQG